MPARWRRPAEPLQVHSHMNGEFARRRDGNVELVAGGYFDKHFWGRQVAYPAYVDALVSTGYQGYVDWEFCHPAMESGKPAGSSTFTTRHEWRSNTFRPCAPRPSRRLRLLPRIAAEAAVLSDDERPSRCGCRRGAGRDRIHPACLSVPGLMWTTRGYSTNRRG